MKIVLRNSYRRHHESGYGRLNQGIAEHVADELDETVDGDFDKLAGDVHLFVSPPYSFVHNIGRYNVGLTMCDKPLKKYDNFEFVKLCNDMDLILVPSRWDREMFEAGGVTTRIEEVLLAHEHEQWHQPRERRENRKVFILDRGRDYSRQLGVAEQVFRNVTYFRNSGNESKKTREELQELYASTDVFLKWAEEGAWSYPALEAMAAGCLVISRCPYVFTNPDNSLTFDNDVDSLRAVLESCLQDDYYEKKLAAQQTSAMWSWQRAAPTIKAAIKRGLEL